MGILDELASDAVEHKPEVSQQYQGASGDQGPEQGGAQPNNKGPIETRTDRYGRPASDDLHVFKDGLPVINKKDGFIRIKPGRTDANTATAQGISRRIGTAPPGDPGAADPGGPPEIEVEAISSANAVFMLGRVLGGPEWEPTEEEQKTIQKGFEAVFQKRGVFHMPPEMTLFVGLGTYAGKRVNKPETKSRIKLLWTWAKWKVSGWFGKGKKKRGKDAQFNRRDDTERQDDAGQATATATKGAGV